MRFTPKCRVLQECRHLQDFYVRTCLDRYRATFADVEYRKKMKMSIRQAKVEYATVKRRSAVLQTVEKLLAEAR